MGGNTVQQHFNFTKKCTAFNKEDIIKKEKWSNTRRISLAFI